MIRKLKSLNSKSAHLLMLTVSLLSVALSVAQQQQPLMASTNGDADGKADARRDFLDANGDDSGKDPSCSPREHSDDYCLAYKAAYEFQWGRMWLQYDCSSGECK